MSDASKLNAVLDKIDADFDNSLERLFALLRIKSISADPAFADDCKAAADHLARDITGIGFTADVRPTKGHPAIIAKSNGGDAAKYFAGLRGVLSRQSRQHDDTDTHRKSLPGSHDLGLHERLQCRLQADPASASRSGRGGARAGRGHGEGRSREVELPSLLQ